MNLKQALKLLLVLMLSSGLAFTVACGDPETGGTTNQENNQNQNNQNQDIPDAGTPDADVDDDDDDDDETVDLAPPTPTCDDDDPPAKCDIDPADADFGTASHVSRLAIADSDCCVDFTGDGDPDNVLPDIIGLAGDLEDVNDGIQDSIDEGSLNLVLEHDGLLELSADADFSINFLIAEEVTEDGATIDPASFDGGTHPHALVPDAGLTENGDDFIIEAGPGSMILSLDLGALTGGEIELDLDLTISNATIIADLMGAQSTIEGGITIENGQIGGLLLIEDLIAALNTFGETCDCLGNPDAIAETSAMGVSCALDDPDTSTCTEDEELCATLADNCDMLSMVGLVADIDVTGDGRPDAFSIGLEFDATPTVILGVGDGTSGDDNGNDNGNGNGNGD